MTSHNSRARTREQAAAVEQMRAEPGTMVFVGSYATRPSANALSYQLRKGGLLAFRDAGPFETETRGVAGRHEVFARYVGAPIPETVTVTEAQAEQALRDYLARLDGELLAALYAEGTFAAEAADLFARLRTATAEPPAGTPLTAAELEQAAAHAAAPEQTATPPQGGDAQ